MERKIDRLRALYESFFSGIERQPPNAPRRELNRLMLEMQQVQIRNAALRFRFQSLSQRWTLLTTYWNRTLREIEAGTYRKDVAKVSRRLAQKGAPLTEQEAVALGIPASRARALVARQEARSGRAGAAGATAAAAATESPPAQPEAPPARAAATAAPRPSGVPGFSEDDLAALHRRYDEAARTTDRPAPTLEQLRDRLAKHVPQVMAHLGTEVAFDVVVKDGRAMLRPKKREG